MKTEEDKFYGHLNSFMEMLAEANWGRIAIVALFIVALIGVGFYFWWRRLRKMIDE